MIQQYTASLTRRRLSPNTIRLRLFYLHKFAANHDLPSATLTDLEAFVDSDPDWSENTQQTIIASLKSFYGWAQRAEVLPKNPARDLLQVRVHRRSSPIASESAIRRGLARATAAERAMILLGAECGLRVSEIARLDRSNRDGRWLRIIGKGSVERSVYMSPELAVTLDEIERTTRWHVTCYFPGRSGTAMHPSTVWRHIRELVGINPHALRHRAGTTVYRNTGNDLRTTQEFLGHASSETTAVYVHVERNDLIRASEASRLAA